LRSRDNHRARARRLTSARAQGAAARAFLAACDAGGLHGDGARLGARAGPARRRAARRRLRRGAGRGAAAAAARARRPAGRPAAQIDEGAAAELRLLLDDDACGLETLELVASDVGDDEVGGRRARARAGARAASPRRRSPRGPLGARG